MLDMHGTNGTNGTNGTHATNGTNGSMAAPDLELIQSVLIEIAKKAGVMILAAHPVVEGVDSKKNCEYTP
jgi:hypothetical protein